MNRQTLLLFDLGGVLVEFSGVEDIVPLLPAPLDASVIRERFATSVLLHAFERGELRPEAFAEAFVHDWEITVAPAVFLREFESWSKQTYPGALHLLSILSERFRLAALSNSNELHWRRNANVLGIPDAFERVISSHETGLRKPSIEAYEGALAALEVGPREVVFFDDNLDNVNAARSVGMTACQVAGVQELQTCLIELGFLQG